MRFQDFDKMRSCLRHWLLGRNYHQALKAMELGLTLHTGLRKDGTPEFLHQISQVQFARTLENELIYPEETFCVLFLHDGPEDHGLSLDLVRDQFGDRVWHSTELFTDVDMGGNEKPLAAYFDVMQFDPIASLGKGIDRMHNFQTMIGVFTPEKQLRYLQEGDDYIIPMLKKARKRFTQQEKAYHNVLHVLRIQMELIRTIRNGEDIIPGTAADKAKLVGRASPKPDLVIGKTGVVLPMA